MPTLSQLFAQRNVSGLPSGGKELLRRTYSSLPEFVKAETSRTQTRTRKEPKFEFKRSKTGTRKKPAAKAKTTGPSLAESFARERAPTPRGSFADQLMALRQQAISQYLQPTDESQRLFTIAARSLAGRPELLAETQRQFAAEDIARRRDLQDLLATEQAQAHATLEYQLERGKFAYEKLQADGEDMAAAIDEMTNDPDEKALLTWAIGEQLQARGEDDDTWTPLDRRNFVSEVYTALRDSGALRGPRQEAPETRTVQLGDRIVTQEFDPYSGTWREIGTGPKWQPGTGPGTLTSPQRANSQEIDAARTRLDELARTLPSDASLAEELQHRMSRVDEFTGLLIPDYNSYWGRIGWLAQQAKIGGDPEHERWSKILIEAIPAAPIPEPVIPDLTSYTSPARPQASAAAPAEQGEMNLVPEVSLEPRTAMTPRGRVGPKPIPQMSVPELAQLFQDPNLTQADRDAIDARLTELGH
jgi:hypothetical protein